MSTTPARRRPRRPAPQVTEPGPLGPAEAAMRAALGLVAEHPALPDVAEWVRESDRLVGSPYLLARPVTALREWLAVLPGPVTVTARVPIGGYGTELVARGRLAGHPVELTVVTYRDVRCNGMGVVSLARLDLVVADESRGLGQPLDPERTGPAVPIEDGESLTIPTPAEVRTGIWT